MENPHSNWHLIARVLNKEATSREEEELAAILREDELLQQQFDLLSRIWKEMESDLDFDDNYTAQSTISRIISKAEGETNQEDHETEVFLPARKSRLKRRLAWAASVILLLVSAAMGWQLMVKQSSTGPEAEAIEAKKGSRSKSILPDGTTVWLNAGSRLSFIGDFSGKSREVKLEGEAFFDVVKQPDHPFIVHTSGVGIKVLGTAFNVKSYPEDKTVETTLYRGSVNVFREEETEKKSIRLKPNEKLILVKEAAIAPETLSEQDKPITATVTPATSFTIEKIDSTKKENERLETAWVFSRLEFRGDRFEELARKLERWYNVTIVFNDDRVKNLSFYGSFEIETVEQAFAALKVAKRFNYNIKGHEIYVGSVQ